MKVKHEYYRDNNCNGLFVVDLSFDKRITSEPLPINNNHLRLPMTLRNALGSSHTLVVWYTLFNRMICDVNNLIFQLEPDEAKTVM